MNKIKTMAQFQAVMREIEERENLFVSKLIAVDGRMFANEHDSTKDFFCIAREHGSERYRMYYLYADTMSEPNYVVAFSREDAIKEMRETIVKVSL